MKLLIGRFIRFLNTFYILNKIKCQDIILLQRYRISDQTQNRRVLPLCYADRYVERIQIFHQFHHIRLIRSVLQNYYHF